MLAGLPLLAFIGLLLVLGNAYPEWGWRRSFLRASVTGGAYVVLTTEGLSLANLIRPGPLAVAWLLPFLAELVWLGRRRLRRQPILFPPVQQLVQQEGRWLILVLLVPLAITAVVAIISPPNTWDSLNYHMPRVAHWAQQASVRPFATGIDIQNSLTPGAEFGMLHLYVLSAGDRWVNLVEWFAMLGSVIGVTLVAERLGVNRLGQILAGVFLATLPMGIVQASSSMTDYVVALWMVAAAAECLLLVASPERVEAALFLAGAVGLALLTKPTAAAYLLPFGVLVIVGLARLRQFRRLVGYGVMTLLIVGLLNLGHLWRSYSLYGTPWAQDRVEKHANELITPAALASNVLRNMALQAGTPWPKVNRATYEVVRLAHQAMGLDLSDPRTTVESEFRVPALNTIETKAGNPLQAILVLVAVVVVVVHRRRPSPILSYTLAVCGTFVVYSWTFKWQIFGSRYFLPFFALAGAVVAGALFAAVKQRAALLVSAFLLLASWPWLTGITTRPLIAPWGGGQTRSILVESRQALYFASGPYLREPTVQITDRIRASGCQRVALMLGGNDAEYTWWVMLGAPRSSVELEWLVGGGPSARYAAKGFVPCAVICAGCEEQGPKVWGLPLGFDRDGFKLYISASP